MKRGGHMVCVLTLALGLVAASAPAAHAFPDIDSFGASVNDGGGGGRYFTGSLRDGLTCAVCHIDGTPPQVDVQGLPPDGYVPGTTYDIDIRWPPTAPPASTGAMLEMLSWQGVAGGDVHLPPASGDEQCMGGGLPPTERLDLSDGRTVIHVVNCGENGVHFQWTAPDKAAGPVWLNAAIVTGNGDNRYGGDGVTTVAKLVPIQGTPAEASVVASSCSVAGPGSTPPIASFLGLVLLLLALALRRRGEAGAGGRRWPIGRARLFRGIRRALSLLALAVLLVIGRAASSHADEGSSSLSIYTDDDGTTVITPSAHVHASLSQDTGVDVGYTADVWSSASIDIRTVATLPVHEQRDELDLGIQHDVGDLHLNASYRISHENDYLANGGSIGASLDVADKAATLEARFSAAHDLVGRHGDPFLFRSVTTLGGRIAYTQVIDPNTIVEAAYELRHPSGFQSSPYRWVGIGGDGSCAGSAVLCIPETHPSERWRNAFGLMGKHALGDRSSTRARLPPLRR